MSHLGPAVSRYIAAGTVLLSREDSRLPGDRWVTLQQSSRWHGFARHDRPLPESPSRTLAPHIELKSPETDAPLLPEETQTTLLKALGPASKLFKHHWVELEIYFCQDAAVVRVYLLPEDVDRRLVNRSNSAFKKIWSTLLQRLNFSPSAWQGDPSAVHTSQPPPQEGSGDDETGAESVSLLHLFNTIPSPNPQTEQLADSFDRDYSYSLLTSKIPGLTTTLYPYQRRSAALMFQRETQPTQTLDPRLSLVTDHHNVAWYYDPASCTALRHPRFYDGVRGGILAEEMGAGKTLICLALVLATRHQPAYAPDIYKIPVPVRPKIAFLADMAASAGSRESVPWGAYFDDSLTGGRHYKNCLAAIEGNPVYYLLPRPKPRREHRRPRSALPATKVFLSRATLALVPANLLQQWRDEIAKHTSGLSVLVLAIGGREIPDTTALAKYELVIFSIPRFERLHEQRVANENGAWTLDSPLAQVHFKRIIVDEGHRLGNSRIGNKSNMLQILEHIQASARWIVTGTPSTGLFGIDDGDLEAASDGTSVSSDSLPVKPGKKAAQSSVQLERKDLERIGSIASLYLKARPWANSSTEDGDSRAEWSVYMMQKKHNGRGQGCYSVLKSTLESLIVRHRKSEIGDLLPEVVERVVYLDGSYQDKLALNLFSMMVISNAVQSQRTDQDFFFHPRQRKSLLQLLANVKQATFFGGAFLDKSDITKACDTAEEFLAAKKIPVSEEDERLLRDAVAVGRLASANKLKHAAKTHGEIPVYVENFPGAEFDQVSQSWCIMDQTEGHGQMNHLVCTDAPILLALQRFVRPWMSSPESLDIVFRSGTFAQRGELEKAKIQETATPTTTKSATLAGNTKLGDSGPPKKSSRPKPSPDAAPDCAGDASGEVAECLEGARLVSTASAKLSYLLDAIVENQQAEKILVFYESENVAYWLAGCLENLQVRHLIYAKSLAAQRRAQYVATFNESPTFRVMLMDLTQAAFGLDMRSASRIYFINPVLNPQVEAQAIGRVRRISQNKAVTVETLVLRGTLEEVVVERRKDMTQAEHQKCKSLLDDKPLLEWFRNPKLIPLPDGDGPDDPAQMAPLKTPLPLFGHGAGKLSHPDEDLVVRDGRGGAQGEPATTAATKRPLSAVLEGGGGAAAKDKVAKRPREAKGVRFVDPAGDE
ncbi:hypothetical protein GGTG_01221 [Gaeumannomyces tritici R3-111a-1]|uniref:Helicase C-terminal domain-containing protein n=1 Tax=Gaeumannomyces tritici (strain R3-111a-1) TaxID=644352 RepID=J3NIY7_GAET3|nr:hypothetical protein GGTG_01221 [Gaeumannomyces tritici R3-111a-1]EJT81237.1 hypothetical protein GGTG_01221 [Gaeumannomyces tritici R3-111a-1]